MTVDEALYVYNNWGQDDDFCLLPEALIALAAEVERLREETIRKEQLINKTVADLKYALDCTEAAEAKLEQADDDKITLDYVERLEQANASLQQQADRGVNCAMKLRIAKEHLQKWIKRAEYAESKIRAANTVWEGIERKMYLYQIALEEIAEFEREIGQPSTEALIATKALEEQP